MGSTFELRYKGGISRPESHANEKFLLFFLVGSEELPAFQLLKDGLIQRASSAEPDLLYSPFEICKVFLYYMKFGSPRQMYSFYLRLTDDRVPEVVIKPFSGSADFHFRARARVLSRKEALNVLPDRCQSKQFLKNQAIPPLDVLRRILSVDRTRQMEGIRKVRI